MNRALGRQEQERVRTARADFYSTLKTEDFPSSTLPESTLLTSPTPTSNTQPATTSPVSKRPTTTDVHQTSLSHKRSKMAKKTKKTTTPEMKDEASSTSQIIVRFYDSSLKGKDALSRTQEEILSWNDTKLESSHNYIQMLFPLPEGSPYNKDAPVINLQVMQVFRSRRELRDRLRQSFERMLAFYGFLVSDKSEEELQQEQQEREAAELEAKATENADPMFGSAAAALKQKFVDAGHRSAATHAAAENKAKLTETYPDSPIDADPTRPKNTEPAKFAFPPGSHTNVSAADPRAYHIIRAPNSRRAFSNWVQPFNHNHLRISRILRCLRILGLQTECIAFFKALERVYNSSASTISARSFTYWRLAVTRPLHMAPDDSVCKWLEGWEKEQENLKKLADEQKLRNERDGIFKEKEVDWDPEVEEMEREKEKRRLQRELEEAEARAAQEALEAEEEEMRIMGSGATLEDQVPKP